MSPFLWWLWCLCNDIVASVLLLRRGDVRGTLVQFLEEEEVPKAALTSWPHRSEGKLDKSSWPFHRQGGQMPFLFCEKLVQQVFSGYLADACKRVQVTMEHTMDGWVSAEPRASLVQAAQPMVTALAPNLLRILARLWTSANITSKVDRAYMFLVRGSELARLLNSDYSRPKGQFEAEKASKETTENWTDQSHPKPPEDAESGQALGEKALDVAKKASKVEAFLPGLSSDPAKPWLLSCVGAQKDASCGETCMSTTKLGARCTCKRACAYFCQQHCNELA